MTELLIEVIQSIFLIIAAIIVLITAIGILRLDDDVDKVIYVRIHMLGMIDMACVLAMIGLGQFLVAGIYFVLAPFLAHAMANAYYYGEDDCNYEYDNNLNSKINDNDYNKLAIGKNNFSVSNYSDSINKITNKLDNKTDNKLVNKLDDKINNELYNKLKDNKLVNKLENEAYEVSKEANNIIIKEVSTDDIENSNLNRNTNRGKNHD